MEKQFKPGEVVVYACSGGGMDYGVMFSFDKFARMRPYKAVSAWGRLVNRPTLDYFHAAHEDIGSKAVEDLQLKVDKYCDKKGFERINCKCKY